MDSYSKMMGLFFNLEFSNLKNDPVILKYESILIDSVFKGRDTDISHKQKFKIEK